jgi:hypothetical protein
VITLRREDEGGLYSACPPGEDQEKRKVVGPYLPSSPRRLENILVRLLWVYLYVYLDNARYTEGSLYSLRK